MKAAMIGAGKLGYPVALAWRAAGHDVVGYDVSFHAAEISRTQRYPHLEPGCQKLLDAGVTLPIVDSVDKAVAHADVVFVSVQTPHEPLYEGATRMPESREDFDYSFLIDAVQEVAACAREQKKHVTLVVISTVLPGTSERDILPHLTVNEYVSYVYAPMFIAQSTVVEDAKNPEFVLLGIDKSDARGVETAREFFVTMHPVEKLRFMSVASAELTKVAYNVVIGMKILAANAFMEIAHKTGANVDDVTGALQRATDRLVSPRYMSAGMGDGGGCFIKGQGVYLERGFIPIEMVEKGDRALGGDGEYHEVLETYRRPYKGPVMTVWPEKISHLGSFTVTPEHPIHVMSSHEVRRPANSLYLQPYRLIFIDPVSKERIESGIRQVTTSQYEGTVYNLNVADVHNYVCAGAVVDNCHPRDQIALSWLAENVDLSYDLFGSMVKAREAQTEWLVDLTLGESIRRGLPIVILGKSYKKGTNLVIGSPAILFKNILDEIAAPGSDEQWDPYVDGRRTFDKAAVFFVATDHDEFFTAAFTSELPKGSVVVDPWGKVPDIENVKVVRVGRK